MSALKLYVKNNPLSLEKHGYPVARSKNEPSISKAKPQGMWRAGQLCGWAAPMSGALTLGPWGRVVPGALVPWFPARFPGLDPCQAFPSVPCCCTFPRGYLLSPFLLVPPHHLPPGLPTVLSEPCAGHHVFMCPLAYHCFSKGSMAKFSVPRYCPSFPSSQDASRQWGR